MTSVTYEPFALMLDSLLGVRRDNTSVETGIWVPSMDIKEEAERFHLYADLPGVDTKDVEIFMENDVLTIKGERTLEKREEKTGYTRLERTSGKFYRRFNLPETADAERIAAYGKNGVLEVVIPKREKAQPRRINVEVAQG